MPELMTTAPVPDSLDVRMARLEGSYEQIDKRLTNLEGDLTQGLAEVRDEIRALRSEMNQLRNLIFILFGALSGLITIFEFIN